MPSLNTESILFMWRADYPRQVKAMEESGLLQENLKAAEDMAGDVFGDAIESGLNPDQAWELEREAVRELPASMSLTENSELDGLQQIALFNDSDSHEASNADRDATRHATPTDTIHLRRRQRPVVAVLRWLAVLPGSMLAALVAAIAVRFGNNFTLSRQGIDPEGFLSRLFVEGMANAVLGAAGVYAGTQIAPSGKTPTAFVLAIGFVLLAGLALFAAIQQQNWWSSYGAGMIGLGAAACAWSVYKNDGGM